MGGEGSTFAMITSLKNNNKLLKGYSYFKKAKNQHLSKYRQHLKEFPKLSKEELLEFRRKYEKQKRLRDIKKIILISVLGLVFIIILVYFFNL